MVVVPSEPVVKEPLDDVVDSVSVLLWITTPPSASVVPSDPVVKEPLTDKVDSPSGVVNISEHAVIVLVPQEAE